MDPIVTRLACFVTAPRNTGDLLADELRALGVSSVSMAAGGVGFETDDLHVVYRVCLN